MMDDAESPGLGLDLPEEPTQPVEASAYRVLARKYRPQTFSELIGQDAMVQTLANAIKRGRIAGIGKAGNPRVMAGVTPGMIVGVTTEVIAGEVVKVALEPRREVWLGWSTTKAILGQRLIPGLLDRYLARKAWESQTTSLLPPGHPHHHETDNVDSVIPGDRGAHGPFDDRARWVALQPWARRNLGKLTVLAAAGALALVWSKARALAA